MEQLGGKVAVVTGAASGIGNALARAFVPHLIAQGEGHVVNTASIAGLTSAPGMGPYNVSKHGVVTLSETLWGELQMSMANVGVSVLCPGWVNTRINESERNRPVGLAPAEAPVEDAERTMVREMLGQLLKTGMDPAEVARLVVEAIKVDRFYVLPHPWYEPITRRVDAIVNDGKPVLGFMPDPP